MGWRSAAALAAMLGLGLGWTEALSRRAVPAMDEAGAGAPWASNVERALEETGDLYSTPVPFDAVMTHVVNLNDRLQGIGHNRCDQGATLYKADANFEMVQGHKKYALSSTRDAQLPKLFARQSILNKYEPQTGESRLRLTVALTDKSGKSHSWAVLKDNPMQHKSQWDVREGPMRLYACVRDAAASPHVARVFPGWEQGATSPDASGAFRPAAAVVSAALRSLRPPAGRALEEAPAAAKFRPAARKSHGTAAPVSGRAPHGSLSSQVADVASAVYSGASVAVSAVSSSLTDVYSAALEEQGSAEAEDEAEVDEEGEVAEDAPQNGPEPCPNGEDRPCRTPAKKNDDQESADDEPGPAPAARTSGDRRKEEVAGRKHSALAQVGAARKKAASEGGGGDRASDGEDGEDGDGDRAEGEDGDPCARNPESPACISASKTAVLAQHEQYSVAVDGPRSADGPVEDDAVADADADADADAVEPASPGYGIASTLTGAAARAKSMLMDAAGQQGDDDGQAADGSEQQEAEGQASDQDEDQDQAKTSDQDEDQDQDQGQDVAEESRPTSRIGSTLTEAAARAKAMILGDEEWSPNPDAIEVEPEQPGAGDEPAEAAPPSANKASKGPKKAARPAREAKRKQGGRAVAEPLLRSGPTTARAAAARAIMEQKAKTEQQLAAAGEAEQYKSDQEVLDEEADDASMSRAAKAASMLPTIKSAGKKLKTLVDAASSVEKYVFDDQAVVDGEDGQGDEDGKANADADADADADATEGPSGPAVAAAPRTTKRQNKAGLAGRQEDDAGADNGEQGGTSSWSAYVGEAVSGAQDAVVSAKDLILDSGGGEDDDDDQSAAAAAEDDAARLDGGDGQLADPPSAPLAAAPHPDITKPAAHYMSASRHAPTAPIHAHAPASAPASAPAPAPAPTAARPAAAEPARKAAAPAQPQPAATPAQQQQLQPAHPRVAGRTRPAAFSKQPAAPPVSAMQHAKRAPGVERGGPDMSQKDVWSPHKWHTPSAKEAALDQLLADF